MGRFEHEAAAVHAASGIVYMTEDRHHSLFYRYIPDVPGRLREGGRLQALAIAGQPALADCTTGRATPTSGIGESLATQLDRPRRRRPRRERPARARRGRRCRDVRARRRAVRRRRCVCVHLHDRRARSAWVRYSCINRVRSRAPHGEKRQPGRLTLTAEAGRGFAAAQCGQHDVAPWGDLVVCEDTVESLRPGRHTPRRHAIPACRQCLFEVGTRGRLLCAGRQDPVRQYPVSGYDARDYWSVARPPRRSRTSTAGSVLPSTNSRKAPPPVEI